MTPSLAAWQTDSITMTASLSLSLGDREKSSTLIKTSLFLKYSSYSPFDHFQKTVQRLVLGAPGQGHFYHHLPQPRFHLTLHPSVPQLGVEELLAPLLHHATPPGPQLVDEEPLNMPLQSEPHHPGVADPVPDQVQPAWCLYMRRSVWSIPQPL